MTAPNIWAYNDAEGGENRPFILDRDPHEVIPWNQAKWDAQDLNYRPWFGPFVEVPTGREVLLRPAPCGAGCYCAAEYQYLPEDAPDLDAPHLLPEDFAV